MAAPGVIIALASSFPVYMLGRAPHWDRHRRLLGRCSAATAIWLVRRNARSPRTGHLLTAATRWPHRCGSAAGQLPGATVGWRGAFMYSVPLAVLAFVWQCIGLAVDESPRAPQRQGSVLRLFRLSTLSLGLLACGLFFMGQFTLFTYVRPFLRR